MKKLIKYIKLLIEAIKENTNTLNKLMNKPYFPYIPLKEIKKQLPDVKPNPVVVYGIGTSQDINDNKWEVKNKPMMRYAINFPEKDRHDFNI